MSSVIAASDLSFAWPEGEAVFSGLSFTVGPGFTALVGGNGSGKSTLLRLIAGELAPGRGSVRVTGSAGYLRQDLTLDAGLAVDEVLGIAGVRRALRAIERGEVDAGHYAAVGDDWDAEERAAETLARLGLGHVGLDRRVGQVSGGEAVLLGLSAQLLRRPGVLLLDEPTNNLDRRAREALRAAVTGWPGTVLVVSHDRGLLSHAQNVLELRDGAVRAFGGGLDSYEAVVAAEQEAAARMVRAAEADVRRERRDLAESAAKLARRRRYGERAAANARVDKMAAGLMKQQAQVTAGKQRAVHEERVRRAAGKLASVQEEIREDEAIRVDLPATAVPAGRTVLAAHGVLRCGARVDLGVRGPERIALMGANGAGKTTFLRAIAGEAAAVTGSAAAAVPVRHLPQRLDVLDDAATVAQNVAAFAPGASPNEVRARLARLGFRGGRADQVVGTLSGGQRFRAALAALLLAEPAPQLLLLDEPTNNLDLASVTALSQALAGYRGALIVASHDVPFLRSAGITRWLLLDGELTETGPV